MEHLGNGEGKCPFAPAEQRHTTAAALSNSDWWPEQLNLKILHQNSPVTNPMGAGFDLKSVDIDISYLFSISNVRNPLENTIRFSLALDIGNSVSISKTDIPEE